MDHGEMAWSGVDWIDLAQDRNKWRALVSAVVTYWELSSGYTTGGLSSSTQLHRVS
jgi:hypothetical protein